VYPDFTNKKTRKWWIELVKKFVAIGVDGIWNDMNEPSVFKTVTKTMPDTNIHRGDEELGGVRPHTYYHNVYGNFQATATFEGMLQANGDKRPFVLSRAGFIGCQRSAATWTGDNLSTWEHLGMSIPMAINLGLSGQPFSGPDIGGFAGDVTPKLFSRWMGIGAMMPFARGHSEKGTGDQEPWSFGPEVEEVCRTALNRRYRLLPHFYTLFYQAHKKGVPVMTPLFFADPSDPSLRKRDDAFLVGPILVSACPTPKSIEKNFETALPGGIWQRFHFNDDNPELPLLFLKGGAIVPTGPVVQHVGEAKLTDTITLLVALDDKGRAEGILYEDDADGFGFESGNYLLTTFEAQQLPSMNGDDCGDVVVRVSRSEGNWARPDRKLHVRSLLGHSAEVEGEGKDGEEVRIKVPSAAEVDELVANNHKHELAEREKRQSFLDEVFQEHEVIKGAGTVLEPIELQSGNLSLTVVPWIGGRIISIRHQPSGYQWLEGRFDSGCYEEYSGSEWRSSGCTEEYKVVRYFIKSHPI
jgi:alpha-glucosidase